MSNIEQRTPNSEVNEGQTFLRNSMFPVRCSAVLFAILASGCTKMITVPIKVAGKTAAASVEAAGDVAAAGVKSGSKVVKSSGVDPQVVNAAVLLAK